MKRKYIAAVLAAFCLLKALPLSVTALEPLPKASTADARIRVDLNANDGRQDAYTNMYENWIVKSGSSDSAVYNGVTFKLSNSCRW